MDGAPAIGFDLDHTLAIDNRLERVGFLRLLERLLERGGHTTGTLADEIDGIDGLLSRQRGGEFSIDDAVRRFAEAHGVEDDDSDALWFRATCCAMVDELVVPLPGVKPTLIAMRERGMPMAILTNGWDPLQRRKAERAGFSGAVLVSSEIGVRKPLAGAFELLVRELGQSPAQTWYVGDDPRGDIAGAHACGLQTVWLNAENQTYPPDLPPPDHTVASFEALLDVLPQYAGAS